MMRFSVVAAALAALLVGVSADCGTLDDECCNFVLNTFEGDCIPGGDYVTCDHNQNVCVVCGANDEPNCDDGPECRVGHVEDGAGRCRTCGGQDQLACEGDENAGQLECKGRTVERDNDCVECGNNDQITCEEGDECDRGFVESNGICRHCGQDGQLTCETTNECDDGFEVTEDGERCFRLQAQDQLEFD